MNWRDHWNDVYREDDPVSVSWYQQRPEMSLAMIEASGVPPDTRIIDIGGGASTLVDCLLDAGFGQVAVLDVSRVALNLARSRLGSRADRVEWIEANVLAFAPDRPFGLWHDRAVFHFLTESEDRRAYVSALQRSVVPGGSVIMATFAPDGPQRCSGLPVRRYDEAMMAAELGPDFRLEEIRRETHVTPSGREQRFIYFRFRYET